MQHTQHLEVRGKLRDIVVKIKAYDAWLLLEHFAEGSEL